jgi:protein ImuB
MPHRRILSLWFPRLAAERLLRRERGLPPGPLAVVETRGNTQLVAALSAEAEAAGLRVGQPLRDAQAMWPALVVRLANPAADAAFLATLRRWAEKFSPWVGEEPPAGLVIDITGAAHLFGGEEGVLAAVEADCAAFGLTVCAGIADTVGAAWALARFAGRGAGALRSGDAIDQEARATRARAARRRHWERGGPAPAASAAGGSEARTALPGRTRAAIAGLPVAALRLEPETVAELTRLGLRRIGDLAGQPRAALARRFGPALIRRLDQALGVEPEPVSPARPEARFAVRLTLPEPIGLEADIMAAIDRLLPALERRLRDKGRGARRLRLELFGCEGGRQVIELGLARPAAAPERIRPLLMLKLGDIEAGFGIDAVRLEAVVTEPVHPRQHQGHAETAARAIGRAGQQAALDDLIGRLGARIGLEAIIRLHPADSHIPEKSFSRLAAAWSEPAPAPWPPGPAPRPLLLWRPEPVTAGEGPAPPARFRWRRREFVTAEAIGPERIAPEWWLDDPQWRSGVRDYWRVTTAEGARLWLFYAHGAATSPGWFCQGSFA